MDMQHIGERIRRYRRTLKKTLLEVATESNLSVGFLSQVERNLTGISISSLVNVAGALKVPLGALIEQPEQAYPDSRQGQRREYALADSAQKYERLSTSFPGSLINAVKVWLPVGYCSEWVSHDGDEFVYVLSGHLRYSVDKEDYPLTPGDSFHFDAHRPHRFANMGDVPTEIITVGTLKLFDDAGAVTGTTHIARAALDAPGATRATALIKRDARQKQTSAGAGKTAGAHGTRRTSALPVKRK